MKIKNFLLALILGAKAFTASAQSVAISQIKKTDDKINVTVVFNNIDSALFGESLLVLQYGANSAVSSIEDKVVDSPGWQEYVFTIPAQDVRFLKATIWNRYLSLFRSDLIVSPLTCFPPNPEVQ